MFAYNECLDSVKYLARTSRIEEKTYCQRLDLISNELGFEGFHQFRTSFTKIPPDRAGRISIRLMRLYCKAAMPQAKKPYVEFYSIQTLEGTYTKFYSRWAGYDKLGREVRVPRILDGLASIERVRNRAPGPVYVIENIRQLAVWQNIWYGTAYIREDVAREAFESQFERGHLIQKTIDLSLVKTASENYDSNISS